MWQRPHTRTRTQLRVGGNCTHKVRLYATNIRSSHTYTPPTIFGKLLDVLPNWPLLITWPHSQKLLKFVKDDMICPLHPPHFLSPRVPLLVSSSFDGILLFLLYSLFSYCHIVFLLASFKTKYQSSAMARHPPL